MELKKHPKNDRKSGEGDRDGQGKNHMRTIKLIEPRINHIYSFFLTFFKLINKNG